MSILPAPVLLLATLLLPPCVPGVAPGQDPEPATPTPGADAVDESRPRLLVFSRTEGFRHASIPAGVECMRSIGGELGYEVLSTEDPGVFDPETLAGIDVVVFMNTTGDILDPVHEAAFEAWFRGGGGWLGIHAAADTEYDWPFYAELVGAYFKSHPAIQEAVVVVEDRDHPATRMLPGLWRRQDEWYTYRMNPRPHVTVLARVDESTYIGGGMQGDHPIAWCHEIDLGRSLYTGGGHTDESFSEPAFRAHLAGAVRWLDRVSDDPPKPGGKDGGDVVDGAVDAADPGTSDVPPGGVTPPSSDQ